MFKWLKDDVLYDAEAPDLERAVCQLLIPKVGRAARGRGAARLPGLPGDLQVPHPAPLLPHSQLSKKDLGEYKATLKDDRGQDVSVLEIAGKGTAAPPRPPAEIRVADGTPRPSKARPPGPGWCTLVARRERGAREPLPPDLPPRSGELPGVTLCSQETAFRSVVSRTPSVPVTDVVTALETGAGGDSNGALHLCGARFSRSLGESERVRGISGPREPFMGKCRHFTWQFSNDHHDFPSQLDHAGRWGFLAKARLVTHVPLLLAVYDDMVLAMSRVCGKSVPAHRREGWCRTPVSWAGTERCQGRPWHGPGSSVPYLARAPHWGPSLHSGWATPSVASFP